MPRSQEDIVVEQLHENRRAILAQHGGDFHSYMESVAARRIPGATYVVISPYSNCHHAKAS